tara:strand:+ start:241163 stop:241495 length:333 start_codon:yes stop_codon:yes gene_type:complete
MAGENDKWEIYEDKGGDWRWRRTASNGEIVGAATEGYANKSDCESNAQRNGMGGCGQGGADDKWEHYKDKAGEWRWRRTASNGNIVGASCEGYVNKSSCEDNAKRHCWNG